MKRAPLLRVLTPREGGFTLIEILIVIMILGILAAIVVAGVGSVQEKSRVTTARLDIDRLNTALQNYVTDEKLLPGQEELRGKTLEPDDNHFPLLYNALLGERRPKGPGGRSAPYTQLERARTVVEDREGGYRPATDDEIEDVKVDKYYLDPWQNPYVYHPNKGRARQPWMKNKNAADIYSVGPNEQDDTALAEDGDDIGNW